MTKEVIQNKNHSDLVQLTDDIMVRLSPPSIDDVIGAGNANQIDLVIKIIRECIQCRREFDTMKNEFYSNDYITQNST